MLKLFYSPGSCALASHLALAESGADYEAVRIDFGKDEQKKPEYLAINPKARVPALITDQGVLTETPAILVYISQAFPDARLAPFDDPFVFAEAQSFNSYLCATVHVAHAHRGRGHRWAYEESSFEDMKRKVPESVGACFELMENEMIKGPWVMGETYSICDMYLYTLTRWLEGDGVDLTRFPKVKEIFSRITERPAIASALEEHFG